MIEAHTIDLFVLALGASDKAREEAEVRTGRSARLHANLDQIARRSGEQITAEAVAQPLGISDRYVRQLLEETGRTFTEHLLDRRLEKAYAMLTNPIHDARKISDIALEAGFNDVSHFNHTFKRRFEETPVGVRARRAGL